MRHLGMRAWITATGLAAMLLPAPSWAQQVNVGGGQVGVSDNFQESFGVGFGPWRLSAEQGSSRSIVGTATSVTMADGASGWFAHGQLRPFVMGWVPVVSERVDSPAKKKLARLRSGEVPSNRSPNHRLPTAGRAARPAPRDMQRPRPRMPAQEDDPPLRIGN